MSLVVYASAIIKKPIPNSITKVVPYAAVIMGNARYNKRAGFSNTISVNV